MPGSTRRSIRSRASSLPRERCRSTARSPPPAATCAVRSRSSATSASIRARRRAKSSVCSSAAAAAPRTGAYSGLRRDSGMLCAMSRNSPASVARRRDRRRGGRRDRRGRSSVTAREEPGAGALTGSHDDDRRRRRDRDHRRRRRRRSTGPAAAIATVRGHPAARRHPRQAERAGRPSSSSRIRSARSATSGTLDTLPTVVTQFVRTGKVKLVYRGVVDHRRRTRCRPARRSTPPAGRTSSGTWSRRSTRTRARRTAAGSPEPDPRARAPTLGLRPAEAPRRRQLEGGHDDSLAAAAKEATADGMQGHADVRDPASRLRSPQQLHRDVARARRLRRVARPPRSA